MSARQLLGRPSRRPPPGGQLLGEVGAAGGQAEREEPVASCAAATGAAEERYRGGSNKPELAVVCSARETTHGDVERGRLAGGDRPVDRAVDGPCLAKAIGRQAPARTRQTAPSELAGRENAPNIQSSGKKIPKKNSHP